MNTYKSLKEKFFVFLFVAIAAAFYVGLAGCASTLESDPSEVVQTPVVVAPVEAPAVQGRIALSWENTTELHLERIPWSEKLTGLIAKDLSLYSTAEDIVSICPKFHSLTEVNKVKALSEFMVALAYYESGYNPKIYSEDVGNKFNKETWSVGLYQMSGTDNSAKQIGATFETLKDPLVNIEVAMIQMKKQISLRGKFFLNNKDQMRYWAVALIGNKFSKIPQIKARTLKRAEFCK